MGNKVGDTTRTVIAGLVIVAVIAGFVALEIAKRDVDSYVYLLGMMAIPTVVSVISARTSAASLEATEKARNDIHQVKAVAKQVEKHVNGNTTRMMNELESLRASVSEYHARYGELHPLPPSPHDDEGPREGGPRHREEAK